MYELFGSTCFISLLQLALPKLTLPNKYKLILIPKPNVRALPEASIVSLTLLLAICQISFPESYQSFPNIMVRPLNLTSFENYDKERKFSHK